MPQPADLLALIRVCGPRILARLVERHTAAAGPVYGVPDLLLDTVDERPGDPDTARFVESRKPEDALSPEQHAEHDVMRSFGLHVRALRLMQPKRRTRG